MKTRTTTLLAAWLKFWIQWTLLTLRYYTRPALHLNQMKIRHFEELYASALANGPDTLLAHNCPYPKYEFLCYLVEHQPVLLHGSNNPSIEVFEPRDQTDFFGKLLKAVFATSDGIWPMYFALLDRRSYLGSLRNGCFSLSNPAGKIYKFYFFSIEASALRGDPWTDGMLYLLPRDSFQPVTGAPDEWISEVPVRPLARLPLSPADFPFLNQVVGHQEEESMVVSRMRMSVAKWRSVASKLAKKSGIPSR